MSIKTKDEHGNKNVYVFVQLLLFVQLMSFNQERSLKKDRGASFFVHKKVRNVCDTSGIKG